MIRLVPNIPQMNVIATAARAERGCESMSGWTLPSPTDPSRRWRIPSSAKKRAAIAPITTHDTAVGRKNTVRKKRQPARWLESRKAIASGKPMATGTARSSIALFFSTC